MIEKSFIRGEIKELCEGIILFLFFLGGRAGLEKGVVIKYS
jgi:hypothetical protein